jgi:transposase
MIASAQHQSWLFYLPLAKQAALLKDDLLEPVDQLLDDPLLVDLVRSCLAARHPASLRTGRPGIAPDRLLRCCVLKHLKGWSFRDLERELRSNLIYRRFTRFDAEATPDFTTFSKLFALLSPADTQQIHQRVVGLAREQGVASGRKLRTDTTCVESNVHYPTDSSLLGDGIRVLSRSLQRIAAECKNGALEVVDHARSVKHRLLEISRSAKCLTEANQQRMRDSYQKLVALTRGVVRQASDAMQRWSKGRLKVVGKFLLVEAQISQLRHFLPLVEKVITQTKERVWGGNCHVEGKVLSLFEPHTEVIRKGKAHKPNEFGRLVRIACASYCTLSHFDSSQNWLDRSMTATPFNMGDISEGLIEKTAHAENAAQQTGPRLVMHGRFRDFQGLAHLFRRQQALFAQAAEPALKVIDPTDILDLL